ncbi:hypothetical protein [Salinibaculum rarum]|jgi:hypothetical protein|uniref:hypothetical protein n=1 Tax=Salinibaculum rarum TaxID=3058903 RepID=UPI00265D69E4|nr:hypothetical protein [Salinibaculum sp. KK48]
MAEIGILNCPVCDQSRAIRMTEYADQSEVKDCVAAHLETHRLSESERGIFRIAMADKLDVRKDADLNGYVIGEWTAEVQKLSA